MGRLAEVSYSVNMDQDEVKVHRKKGKRIRQISSHLARTSLVNKDRRNIAVSIIKNCYFVRCKRKPTVSIVLFFLAWNQCGQSRARKMSAFCPLRLLRNQYTGFPFILPTVTASDPTNRCMLFLSHGALELV